MCGCSLVKRRQAGRPILLHIPGMWIADLKHMAQDAKQAMTDMDDHVAAGRVKLVDKPVSGIK